MKASVRLPRRVFNSPLIKFANFEAGNRFINLIRLTKPYANGNAYAISEGIKDGLMFKTLEQAERKFDSMVESMKQYYPMTSGGRTGNYDLPRPSASVSPATEAFLGKTTYQYRVGNVFGGATYYAASPRFEGTTCHVVMKGGRTVSTFKTEYDMLAGKDAYGHYQAAQPITSLGMFVDEMEDERFILTPPFKEFTQA